MGGAAANATAAPPSAASAAAPPSSAAAAAACAPPSGGGGKPISRLHERLSPTPAWASAISLGFYLYLWTRGLAHACARAGVHPWAPEWSGGGDSAANVVLYEVCARVM